MKRVTLIILALIAAALFAPQRSPAQQKRALLVQVSEFKNPSGVPKIGELGEAQLDAATMQKTLSKYGFQVTVLNNSQASQQKVLAALDEIARTAKPDDAIVFYFSGHGANTQNGDFSLCPWDALAKSSRNDITENDIQRWLDKLQARNVTLILDCCFSKLGLRGLIPYRPKFIGRNEANPEPDLQRVHLSPDRMVILAAAGQNGMALQIAPPNKPGWIGLFTLCLANELEKAKAMPETTFHSMADNVKRDVQQWTNNQTLGAQFLQTPAIYGSDRLVNRALFAPVFSPGEPAPSPAPATKPYVLVTKIDGSEVYLAQGTKTSVNVGSEYDLYPEGETQLTDMQRRLGSIRIKQATEDQAIGDLLDGDAARISPNCRAVLTRFANSVIREGDLTLRLEGSPQFQAQMQQALQKLNLTYLTLTTDNKQAAHAVLKAEAGSTEMNAQLLSSDGVTPMESKRPGYQGKDADDLAEQIRPMLNQLATLRTIVHLDNPNPAFRIDLIPSKPQFAEGDEATFTCKSDRDCYVILIDVDPVGFPRLLYPRKSDQPDLIKANTPLTLPPPDIARGFRVMQPFGKESVIALATTDKEAAETVKQKLFDMQQRALEAMDGMQQLQTGPLDTWSITMLDVLTLSKAESASNK